MKSVTSTSTLKTGSSKKVPWRGIQIRTGTEPVGRSSLDGRKRENSTDSSLLETDKLKKNNSVDSFNEKPISRSRSSSILSDDFEDAIDDVEDVEDEDDDYFQDENAVEEVKKETKKDIMFSKDIFEKKEFDDLKQKQPTRMSFILPALQNTGFSDDDDDLESLEDPNEKHDKEQIKETVKKEEKETLNRVQTTSSDDLVAEIEALEIASLPIGPSKLIKEKPATYEPIPNEMHLARRTSVAVKEEVTAKEVKAAVPDDKLTAVKEEEVVSKEVIPAEVKVVIPIETVETKPALSLKTTSTKDIPANKKIDGKNEILTNSGSIASEEHKVNEMGTKIKNEPVAITTVKSDTPAAQPVVNKNVQPTAVPTTPTIPEVKAEEASGVQNDKNTSVPGVTSRTSNESMSTAESVEQPTPPNEREFSVKDHLASILPAVEQSIKNISHEKSNEKKNVNAKLKSNDRNIMLEEHERATHSREFEYSIEDPIDLDLFKDNVIAIQAIDPKNIPVNNMKPREQEKADEIVATGIKYLFDNKFMKAKNVFQSKANQDPLYALGLGSMAFIKAIMVRLKDIKGK
ncbi:hypothetical protein BDB01DRAFT_329273 [Pilobolus umbonatus]|nr:hypothetical protein BDB01DRAFT_329273 [Pilobolus umbonatus]